MVSHRCVNRSFSRFLLVMTCVVIRVCRPLMSPIGARNHRNNLSWATALCLNLSMGGIMENCLDSSRLRVNSCAAFTRDIFGCLFLRTDKFKACTRAYEFLGVSALR